MSETKEQNMDGLTIFEISQMDSGTNIYDNKGDRWQVVQVFRTPDRYLQFMKKGADPDIETIESAIYRYGPFSKYEGVV